MHLKNLRGKVSMLRRLGLYLEVRALGRGGHPRVDHWQSGRDVTVASLRSFGELLFRDDMRGIDILHEHAVVERTRMRRLVQTISGVLGLLTPCDGFLLVLVQRLIVSNVRCFLQHRLI